MKKKLHTKLKNNLDENFLYQYYINAIYDQTNTNLKHAMTRTVSETYGEILFESVSKLLSVIPFTENDIFVDLGSGLGKVVLQVFLQTLVKEARGIEIKPYLHEQALIAAHHLQRELPQYFENRRQLTLFSGDFLKIPLTTATIILMGSPCFDPAMLHSLAKMIDDTPSIHTVFSLRPLCSLQRLAFKKAIRIECSWDTALCYLYR